MTFVQASLREKQMNARLKRSRVFAIARVSSVEGEQMVNMASAMLAMRTVCMSSAGSLEDWDGVA